jgi:prevent-host-death family protein
MVTVSVTEAKNQLSALLKRVRKGETILIADRGTPVATLQAVHAAADDERIARLERAGILRPPRRPPSRELLAKPAPKPRSGVSVLEALLEERREGR